MPSVPFFWCSQDHHVCCSHRFCEVYGSTIERADDEKVEVIFVAPQSSLPQTLERRGSCRRLSRPDFTSSRWVNGMSCWMPASTTQARFIHNTGQDSSSLCTILLLVFLRLGGSRKSSCDVSNNSSMGGGRTKRGMSDSLYSALSWLWDLCRLGETSLPKVGGPGLDVSCTELVTMDGETATGWRLLVASVINPEMRAALFRKDSPTRALRPSCLTVCHPLHHLLLCSWDVILPLPNTEWRYDSRIARHICNSRHHLLETGHLGGCIWNWAGDLAV